jgi:uncharacterized protein (DUF1015 family)
MATLHPFRALRPAPAAAPAVAAVPYDVINADEARTLAAGKPLSFLHISRAELGLAPSTDPYSDVVYDTARQNFDRLKTAAPLVADEAPSVYFYRLRMGAHVQTGLAACYSLDEYDGDVILKHEKTRKDKEDDRTRHMLELGAQTGPVFLTYTATPEIDALAASATAGSPLYDFTAEDGVQHTIWRVSGETAAALVRAMGRVPRLYIADGHHRAASASRTRAELRRRGVNRPEADTFLAVAFPHDQVQILAYNRLVKDLGSHQRPGELIEAVGKTHQLTPGPAVPATQGEVSMFVAGHWFTVPLKRSSGHSPSDSLDVSLLHDQILAPRLGIGDERSDKRIDFVGGGRGTSALEHAVGSGKAAVAFSLAPVSVKDLMAISDAGEIMPPKSTWFEPKLRDGLLIHEF